MKNKVMKKVLMIMSMKIDYITVCELQTVLDRIVKN